MLEFNWVWAFMGLPLPIVIYFLIPAKRAQQGLRVPFFQALQKEHSHGQDPQPKFHLYQVLNAMAWCLFITALADPRWIGEPIELTRSSRDMFLAVDLSNSMAAEDMSVNNRPVDRLVIVKQVVSDFISKREGTRLGLVAFGTNAYVVTPLTFDLTTVNKMLDELQIGMAGEATAIGDSIALAVKRLKDNPQAQRTLILLTDGQNTAGKMTPDKALELAKQLGVKIYTIGIGAKTMVQDMMFFKQTIQNNQIDEETLTKLAQQTGGQYFRAENPRELQKIYQLIDEMEPIESDSQTFRPISSLFFYPLLISLALWLLGFYMTSQPRLSRG